MPLDYVDDQLGFAFILLDRVIDVLDEDLCC